MDIQSNVGELVRAIAVNEISEVVEKLTIAFRTNITQMLHKFVEPERRPRRPTN